MANKKIRKMNREEVINSIKGWYRDEAIYLMRHNQPISIKDQGVSTTQLRKILRSIKKFERWGRNFLILDNLTTKEFRGGAGWSYNNEFYISLVTEDLEFK